MDGVGNGFPVTDTQLMGRAHIDAAAKPQKEAGKQGDQKGGGAHRAKCQISGEFSRNGHIAEVK